MAASENDKSKKVVKGNGGEPKPTKRYTEPAQDSGYAVAAKSYGSEGYKTRTAAAAVKVSEATLKIIVYGMDRSDLDNAYRPDSPRLSEEVVLVIDAQSRGSRDEVTTVHGTAVKDGLARQLYTVTAIPPPGYQAARPLTADLSNGDQTYYLGLRPKEGVLLFQAYFDAKCCGDPTGQDCIEEIEFEVTQADGTTTSYKTSSSGPVDVPITRPGPVLIKTPPTARFGSQVLRASFLETQMAYFHPGDQQIISRAYMTATSKLLLTAVYVKDPALGTSIPMPELQVRLYPSGNPNGSPRRERTLSVPASLDELPPGDYTVEVLGPKWFAGEAVEVSEPPGGRTVVTLSPGSPFLLAIRFQQALGKVCGFVFEEGTQKGRGGVDLLLYLEEGGPPLPTVTGPQGDFEITGVPAGTHTLMVEEAKVTDEEGRTWVLAAGSPRRQKITVRPDKPTSVSHLFFTLEKHILKVRVVGPGDKPFRGGEVEVRDESNVLIDHPFALDDHGEVFIEVPRIGSYSVSLGVHETGLPRLAAKTVFVNEDAEALIRVGETNIPAKPFQGGGAQEAVVDIPYPLLTEGGGFGGGSGGMAAGASFSPGLAPLGGSVEGTIREVLGWRPRASDARGFLAALNQAFDLKEVEGHTEFTWKPRSYAVQHDLGAVTGAQASIYSRARVALDNAIPLLEGLEPLRADSDEEDTEAVRSIVKNEFSELVAELGQEGGPRVARVDTLFDLLLGSNRRLSDPEQVEGLLRELRNAFGLQRNRVNTVSEEQNLTNFLILVDYIHSLRQSWESQRRYFTRGSGAEPFFGTQLVHVSRSLAVISESVQEVYRAMDSVFLGAAERQVIQLTYTGGEPPLFVSELLSWVDQAASEQGPRLLQEGGKAGAVAFLPTLRRLRDLVRGALLSAQNGNELPAGYRTARVQRALQELGEHLNEAVGLVEQIGQQAVN